MGPRSRPGLRIGGALGGHGKRRTWSVLWGDGSAMPTIKEAIEDLNWQTERLSNRVWTICAGVIALSLTYIVESMKTDGVPFLLPRQVAIPAAIALAALFLDLLQYFAADQQTRSLLARMEKDDVQSLSYDKFDAMYRLRNLAYYGKIVLGLAAAIWMILLSVGRVISLV